MKMLVCKIFRFSAAHYLPNYDGMCSRLHGHTWILEVEVEGPVDSMSGMVVDFAELKRDVNDLIIDVLDHTCLNDLGLPFSTNPTCENVLQWIWDEFRNIYVLSRLRLYESPDSFAELKI